MRIVNGAARGSISGCWDWEGLQFLVVFLEQDRPWERAGAAAPGSRAEPRLSGWAPPLGFQQVVWTLGRPPLRVGPPQMVPSPPLLLSHWEAAPQISLLDNKAGFEISYLNRILYCKGSVQIQGGGSSCSFVSHICFIKCVNRTFRAKMRRKWFVLLCQKGVRKVTVFVAIFHSVYFFMGLWNFTSIVVNCAFFLFLLSVFSQCGFFFFLLLMFRSNLPLSVFPRDSSIWRVY